MYYLMYVQGSTNYELDIQPAQLSYLGGSAGRASAWYAGCRRFQSRLRQLIFYQKKELSSGVAVLHCLVSD